MTDVPDFDAYTEAACVAFWGEPDKRNFKELRWGGGNGYGGRSYNIKKKMVRPRQQVRRRGASAHRLRAGLAHR
jgi:hypothetical protein